MLANTIKINQRMECKSKQNKRKIIIKKNIEATTIKTLYYFDVKENLYDSEKDRRKMKQLVSFVNSPQKKAF